MEQYPAQFDQTGITKAPIDVFLPENLIPEKLRYAYLIVYRERTNYFNPKR